LDYEDLTQYTAQIEDAQNSIKSDVFRATRDDETTICYINALMKEQACFRLPVFHVLSSTLI